MFAPRPASLRRLARWRPSPAGAASARVPRRLGPRGLDVLALQSCANDRGRSRRAVGADSVPGLVPETATAGPAVAEVTGVPASFGLAVGRSGRHPRI